MLSQNLRRLAMRAQARMFIPHPREDVLCSKQVASHCLLRGESVCRPAGGTAVGVRGLMERRVNRITLPGRCHLHVDHECGGTKGQLQQVVQPFKPGAVAEPHPNLPQPTRCEAVAVGQAHVFLVEPAQQHPQTIEVSRVSVVIALIRFAHAHPCRRVDLVHGPIGDRREASGDQYLPQTLGRQRQISERGESAEALTQQTPAVDAEFGANQFEIAHDRVGAKMREVLCLVEAGCAWDDWPDRRGSPCAPLVKQQDPELGQGTRHPS